jgi:hypothetical protein
VIALGWLESATKSLNFRPEKSFLWFFLFSWQFSISCRWFKEDFQPPHYEAASTIGDQSRHCKENRVKLFLRKSSKMFLRKSPKPKLRKSSKHSNSIFKIASIVVPVTNTRFRFPFFRLPSQVFTNMYIYVIKSIYVKLSIVLSFWHLLDR